MYSKLLYVVKFQTWIDLRVLLPQEGVHVPLRGNIFVSPPQCHPLTCPKLSKHVSIVSLAPPRGSSQWFLKLFRLDDQPRFHISSWKDNGYCQEIELFDCLQWSTARLVVLFIVAPGGILHMLVLKMSETLLSMLLSEFVCTWQVFDI